MAWNKWKKAPTKKPPPFSWDRDLLDIVGVVIKNKIKIAMTPDWNHSLNYWQIDIKVGYKYYYNKYKLNTNKDG